MSSAQTLAPPSKSVSFEAQSALQASPFYDLRELKVEETADRRLMLRGMVSSFYHKQLAQEVVLGLAKSQGYRVVNAIEVMDTLTN
jgi:hypothetical protein